jgi:hypothetical protein
MGHAVRMGEASKGGHKILGLYASVGSWWRGAPPAAGPKVAAGKGALAMALVDCPRRAEAPLKCQSSAVKAVVAAVPDCRYAHPVV